jgi:ribonuclease G
MKKEIIINVSSSETRIAILEDGALVEIYAEQPENERMVGDIYKGKIENVVEGIQAAFVNVGLKQNGFLPFSEVGGGYSGLSEMVKGEKKKRRTSRKKHADKKVKLKQGQDILVQVTKEPLGSKGTRLTSAVSLPGRFLVLVPFDNKIGVSQKIVDIKERRRLRMLAKSLQPKGFGLIIRTVAVGKDAQTIRSDLDSLFKTWKKIEDKYKTRKAPALMHKDLEMASSVIRDLFSPDIDRLVVDSRKNYGRIKKYLKDVAPGLLPKLELYKKRTPLFDELHIEEEIEKSLSRKNWMKGGGYVIFDQTEAMVVVDVNSGRSVGEKDHEKNALKTDLEAARTIARQLRLRDIGGIIVIDFIDLIKGENRRKVLSELKKQLKKDRAAFDILPMSDFGIIQLTRERVRPSLLYQYSEPCPRCSGLGRTPSKSAVATKIERKLQQLKSSTGERRYVLKIHPDIAEYLTEGIRNRIGRLMMKHFVKIQIVEDHRIKDENFVLTTAKETKQNIKPITP